MNAETVAEMTFTLALSLLRRVNLVDRALRLGEDLSKVGIMGNTLRGKVVGIVGMGAIAHRAAELFRDTFQCELHVYSPTSSTDKWTENDPSSLRALPHTRHASLDTLLPIVDILTLHCPLTPSTHLLIGEKELATMKTSGLLINTARGGVVDEVALEVALREKVIAGAAVDVWEVEPPPPAKYGGLISQPTCISLPHMGALTNENQTQCCILAVDQLADHLDGKVVGNRVV
nr:phosphoglycerate dehydrogenase [Phaffia rhodozyma]